MIVDVEHQESQGPGTINSGSNGLLPFFLRLIDTIRQTRVPGGVLFPQPCPQDDD